MTDSKATEEFVEIQTVEKTQEVITTAVNKTTDSSTEKSQTSSSGDKIVDNNEDIDFSIVDALPPQINEDTDDKKEQNKKNKKGKDDKKKDDKKSETIH